MKKILLVLMIFITIITLSACSKKEENTILIYNPYEGVDWDTINHFIANLHGHTTHSDGGLAPAELVDLYHSIEYSILAITDHDDQILTTTWPWTAFSELMDNNPYEWENRDPEALGMLAVPGNEYSINHHFVGLFTTYMTEDDEALDTTMTNLCNETGVVTYLAHPGRYWKVYTEYQDEDEFSPAWYRDIFTKYSAECLVGMEVYSQQNRHPHDKVLWDMLLTMMMPHRPIFGLGSDDYHRLKAGWSATVHLMDNLNEADLRDSLTSGQFFTHYTQTETEQAPIIERIIINTEERYIEIISPDAEEIRWYSGINDGVLTSRVVHTGNRFYYGAFEGSYVRAEAIKNEANVRRAYTILQPFGFTQLTEENTR
jgi:hypothetical protein